MQVSGVSNNFDLVDIDAVTMPASHPSVYCRLCFSITNLGPIFGYNSMASNKVVELIKQLTTIELHPQGDAMCSICRPCSDKLDEFGNFRNQCLVFDEVISRQTKQLLHHNLATNPPPLVLPISTEVQPQYQLAIGDVTSLAASAEDTRGYEIVELNEESNYNDLTLENYNEYEQGTENIHQLEMDASFEPNNDDRAVYEKYFYEGKYYWKCTQCDALMSLRSSVNRHISKIHVPGVELPRIKCVETDCNATFVEIVGLKRHVKIVHGKIIRAMNKMHIYRPAV
ncbi:uncharacterized protein LOC129755247 [Uranotaenia lowii]|uniref:uncharacterized protein LOC129755247 n=1 Tax=Uranotaenia lowii TaxID=190385 RepID=UPI0024786347|nr:uncharacterized protein LOC129755247 [Uranotaenia lowii]